MDFHLLGPLEVVDGGQPVLLGEGRQRSLLTVLLLHANEALSSDRLVDLLWGERPPATAAKVLQNYVAQIRRALGDREAARLQTRGRSYALRVEPGELDLDRFDTLARVGAEALRAGAPAEASAQLAEALSLWRGEPLADVAYESFAQPEIARLQARRLAALAHRIEADLALGRHADVIAELDRVIGDHPLDERLRALLMLALYRSGRQGDALQSYQELRRALAEELGLEPGSELRQLEQAILDQDPALAAGDEPRAEASEPVSPDLPTGVVTFLLTDIEGSTPLWESHPEAMEEALELHDALILHTVESRGGRLLKTKGEGDATLAAFRRASDAVACAVELQAALRGASWPGELDLRVRVALHTGEAHEREGDYFGLALSRAARLRSLARGGGVVLSQVTAEIVRDRLPEGVALHDLGHQTLRGLSRPDRVFELRLSTDGPPDQSPPAVPTTHSGVGGQDHEFAFVGRERELAELVSGLERALAGHGGVFLVAGEPGIGKSRLADELATQAIARGARVLTGRGWEAGGAPAYWPWLQALRAYIGDREGAWLRRELGSSAPVLAQILPELDDPRPDAPQPPPLEPEAARFRLFEAIAALLRGASNSQPVVVVLDDVHAADAPSLLLLRFLATQLARTRVMILATYRDVSPTLGEPLASTLAELARERTTRLDLKGLTEMDVGRFVEHASGHQPDTPLVHAIFSRTDGNPLFVGEMLRLLRSEGRLELPEADLAMPFGVTAVIDRRLSRLSGDCRSVLEAAAILGREFATTVLARVCGRDEREILEILDEAIGERVVGEVPGASGRLRFGHALIRDALYAELAASRRMAMHLEAAEALEAHYRADLEPHRAELAAHFRKAGAGGVERALDHARRAGQRAVRLLAFEEAVRLFQLALEVTRPGDDATRCELLLELGDAQTRAGDGKAAREAFLEAAALARSTADSESLARAALGYGGRFVWVRAGRDRRLVPLLEEAQRALGETETPLRVRLLIRLAGAVRDQPDREASATLTEAAVAMARRLDDPATLAAALEGRAISLLWPEKAEERLAIADELIALDRHAPDTERTAHAHFIRLLARLELADMPGVLRDLEDYEALSDELRQPAWRWLLVVTRATLALFEGRLDDADRLVEEGLALGGRAVSSEAVFSHHVQRTALGLLRGEFDGLDALLERSIRDYPARPVFRCMLACLQAERGRPAEAAAIVTELAPKGFSAIPRTIEYLFSLGFLTDALARLPDPNAEYADTLVTMLVPFAERNAASADVLATGSVSRSLGVLAGLLGRFDEAEARLKAAVASNRAMGARPWAALTLADHARMLTARGLPGDREGASRHLREALAEFEALGMDRAAAQASEALAPAP